MWVERRKVRTEDVGDAQITNDKLAPGTITYDRLAADTIRLEVPIPLLTDAISGAATVEAPERLVVPDLTHVKAAYFEVSYDASALTADGSAELYDVTAASTVASITLAAGSTSERTRSADIKGALTPGNEVKVRVTGDGTNAATLRMARLVMVIGIS